MKLKLLTPDKPVLVDVETDSVTLPGALGEMTVLEGHASLLSSLRKGGVCYRLKGKELGRHQIEGGFVEVMKNTVLVLTPAITSTTAQTAAGGL